MPEPSVVVSSAEKNGDDHSRDTEANINDGKLASDNAADRVCVEDAEKGPPPSDPLHVVKDGGLTAWSTALGAWCMTFCAFGLTHSYGVYQDYYVRVHLSNYPPSTIGWIGSFQVFLQFGGGLIAGIWFDKGYFYPMTFGSSLLLLFSNFMLSLSQPQQFYQVFLTQGIAIGISLGGLYVPTLTVLSHHFARKRALAMGIAVSGASAGGVVFPVVVNRMLEKYGFPWAVRIAAFICLGLVTISLACMRTRPPPPRPHVEGQQRPSLVAILKDVPYILAVLGCVAVVVGIFFIIFYLQLYAIMKGIDSTLASYTLTILNGASIFGRIIPNFLADDVGVYNVLIVTTFACGVITLATLAVDDAPGVICLAAFYGFFSGAHISLVGPLFASLSRSINEVGLRMGLAFATLAVGGLVGSPIHGALLTSSFYWDRPIIFSAVCFFVGTISLIVSREWQVRRKGTWKV